jgi:hypothetical protein
MPNRRSALGTIAAGKSKSSFLMRVSARAATAIIVIAFVSAAPTVAQETPKPADQTGQENPKPPGQSQTIGEHVSDAAKKPVEIFNLLEQKSIVFPDIAANTQPLSPAQKFKLFVDNSISVHAITASALGSAIGQAANSPTGFGQGWDAYGKRFGSSMARGASGEFFGTFMLASALHEDPRFFPEVNPRFGHAMKYSVQRLFVTRNDAGRDVANVSGLVGPLLGEGLANAYWPDRNRTAGDTLLRYGVGLAARAGGNMLREYWPTVYRKLNRSSAPAAAGH